MDTLNFDNRWVMVIGATGGVGRAVCRYLQSYTSCKLLLCDIETVELKELAATLRKTHTVEIVTTRLKNQKKQKELFDLATNARNIYTVIYSAGLNYHGPSRSTHITLFNDIININFLAPMYLTMLFNEYFNKRKEGGILLFTSLAAKTYSPYQNIYAVSKIALDRFIRSLIYENAKSPVTISQIYPGSINTKMTTNAPIYNQLSRTQRRLITPVELVVKHAMTGFIKRKSFIYTKQFSSIALRVISYLAEHKVAKSFGRAYKKLLP